MRKPRPAANRAGWIRVSRPGAPTCHGHWRFEPNGNQARHCGHPTAIYPYYVDTADGRRLIAQNGHGFFTLLDAMIAAESGEGAIEG